ncbi:MAG: hypothetical protein Q8K30_06540 [Candidatus Gracilibacteria bacterium]|nr:hypothetical protein [Candidatus Gracilibacteria bacterium]
MIKNIFTFIYIVFIYSSNFLISFASNDDIKGIRGPLINLNNFLLYQFVIIFLLILLILYYHFYVDKNIKLNKIVDEKLEKKKLLIKGLNKLKKDLEKYQKSDFYSELNTYFRKYFSLIGIMNSETLTLKELKSINIDKNIINIFEQSYFNEFNDKKDDLNNRKEIIEQLIKYIK